MAVLRGIIVFITLAASCLAVPVEKSDKQDLQQLQLDAKVKALQEQISQLQSELEQSEKPSGPLTAANPSKTAASVAGVVKAEVGPNEQDSRDVMSQQDLAFPQDNDLQQRQIGWQPMKKRLVGWQPMRKRLVGWQPMRKRLVGWQPMKRTDNKGPRFKLTMKANEDLRDEMMDAVERRLIDDLTAAQKYGIEPQQILQDLRSQNAARTQRLSWDGSE